MSIDIQQQIKAAVDAAVQTERDKCASQLVALQSKLEQSQAQCNHLLERNQVIRIGRDALTELLHIDPSLSVSNYIQDITIMPAQHEPLRQEITPDAIVNAVHHWMNYYWKDDITRCDRNARACWATICGGLHRDWVFCGTESLTAIFNRGFATKTITEWSMIYDIWKHDSTKIAMIVRFIGVSDGHSVVLYKYLGKTYVFQAYYNVCPVHVYVSGEDNNIFCDNLNAKLERGEQVSSHEFGNVSANVVVSDSYSMFRYMMY